MNAQNEICPFAKSARSPYRRSAALCVIALAMAFVSACLAVQSGRRATARLDLRANADDRDWADALRQAQAVEELRRAQQSILHHAELAEMLVEKTPRSAVLAEVANAMPAGCGLAEVNLDLADTAGDSLHVQIAGVAPGDAEVGQYIDRLRRSSLLQNVKLSASQSAREQGLPVRNFRIDLDVGDSDAPYMRTAQPTLTASIGH